MADEIKVAIVDDDLVFTKTLSIFLNQQHNILVAATARTADEALGILRSIDCDIVVLDLNLTGIELDGFQLAYGLLNIKPVRIIILTSYESPELVQRAHCAGAVSFLNKRDYHQLPLHIEFVYASKTIGYLLDDYKSLKKEHVLKVLTPGERRVFELFEEKNTTRDVAQALFVSVNTVKNQVSRILKKLSCSSMKEAVEKVNRARCMMEKDITNFSTSPGPMNTRANSS